MCAGRSSIGWRKDQTEPPRCPARVKWTVYLGPDETGISVCGSHLAWIIGQHVKKPWDSVTVVLAE